MCKPSPPPPPDYAAAATAQGAANKETAIATSQLNNPNVVNPYGTQTWTDATSVDQAGYDAALRKYNADLVAYNTPTPAIDGEGGTTPGSPTTGTAPVAPTIGQYTSATGGRPTLTQTLNPEQKALFDKSVANKGLLADLAKQGADSLKGVIGTAVDFSGAPDRPSSAFTTGAPALRGTDFTTGAPDRPNTNFIANAPFLASAEFGAGAPNLNSTNFIAGVPVFGKTDFASGAPNLRSTEFTERAPRVSNPYFGEGVSPLPDDYNSTRDSVINAMMGRVNEDYGIRRDDVNSNLIAAGIRPGTKAYGDQMQMIERSRNDARQQAEIAGGNAAQQAAAFDMARRQQGISEQKDIFSATMAARGQMTAEQRAMFDATFSARAQAVGESRAAFEAIGQVRSQMTAEQRAMFDASQSARQQTIGEQKDKFGASMSARGQYTAEQQAMAAAQAALRQSAVAENQAMFGASAQARQQAIAENQAMAAFQAELRRSAISEQLMKRQTPLNEITALMSGSQVANPFAMPGVAQNAQIAPPPLYNAAMQAGQYGTDVYNAEVGQSNAMMSGLFGLGGAALAGPYGFAAGQALGKRG